MSSPYVVTSATLGQWDNVTKLSSFGMLVRGFKLNMEEWQNNGELFLNCKRMKEVDFVTGGECRMPNFKGRVGYPLAPASVHIGGPASLRYV